MTLHDVKLDDKYDLSKKRVLMSGIQAIVRLTMMQHERDRKAGKNCDSVARQLSEEDLAIARKRASELG